MNFTALVICGNGDGVAGYGKGKSADVSAAVDKVGSLRLFNTYGPAYLSVSSYFNLCICCLILHRIECGQAYARALRNLHYFERFDGHTIFHEKHSKYGQTKVSSYRFEVDARLI